MQRTLGIIFMFLAACSYGAAGVLIKLAYRSGMHPATLLTLQNLVAIVIMWPILLVMQGYPKASPGQIRRLTWQGLGGNFALSVCYFWSAQRIDVSLLSIILFTYPGLVLAYQIVVENHRPRAAEILALALALIGAVLSADPFHGSGIRIDSLGLLLAVGAAVSYAFMNLHGQKISAGLQPMLIATSTSTVSTLALLAFFPWLYRGPLAISGTHWLYIISLAVVSTALPMNLMFLALKRIGAFHASVVSIVELPCILVLAYFLLRERMNLWQSLGGAVILASLVLMQCLQNPVSTAPAH